MATKAFNNDALRQTAAERPRLTNSLPPGRANFMKALGQQVPPDVFDLVPDTSFGDGLRAAFAIGQALTNGFIATT